jgi:hypothetical protein
MGSNIRYGRTSCSRRSRIDSDSRNKTSEFHHRTSYSDKGRIINEDDGGKSVGDLSNTVRAKRLDWAFAHERDNANYDIYRHEVMREPARKYGLNMMYERGGVF